MELPFGLSGGMARQMRSNNKAGLSLSILSTICHHEQEEIQLAFSVFSS